MIHRLLCRLGIHYWHYWQMAESWQRCFPEKAGVGRECRCCGCLQYLSDDRKRWDIGLKGTFAYPTTEAECR
jgi:hypothetical protein